MASREIQAPRAVPASSSNSAGGRFRSSRSASESVTRTPVLLSKERALTQSVGSPVYDVPEITVASNVEYERHLTAGWSGFTRLDYSHVSGSYTVNTQVTPLYRPAYNIGDFRLGGRNERYEVAAVRQESHQRARKPGRRHHDRGGNSRPAAFRDQSAEDGRSRSPSVVQMNERPRRRPLTRCRKS